MSEQRWDNEAVAKRLEEAADVLARLPAERVRGLYDCGRGWSESHADTPGPQPLHPRRSIVWRRRSVG